MQAGDRREIFHYDRGRLTTRTVEYTQDPEGKTYTYRYDAQGNTLGDGENTYLYDCLNRIAEVQTKAGDIQKNHYDAVTGQYYLRARFYNPVIARFLSEDTYYGDGLNLHAYCHNNPVGYVDPSGHEGLICSKKYGELKKKETEGGTLSEKEKRQIYEYEQNQKKSNGAGSDSKSGSSSVKTDFYVKPNGELVPATGYRYMPAEASYMDSLKNTMEIPANSSGTYITFDKFDVPTPGRLQVPHDASIRGSFDTLQIIDDIRVPNGKWGQASWLEPITKDFPKYGPGGATQALTYQKIKLNSLKNLSR